jgi:PAS domain S-box-containing protein
LAARAPVLGETILMADGHVLERDYVPVFVEHSYRGHLWRYLDVTARVRGQQRLEAVSAVSRALADAGDEEDGHQRALEAVCAQLGWQYAASFILAGDGTTLSAIATTAAGVDEEAAERYQTDTRSVRFQRGEGLPGLAWLSGQTQWTAQLDSEPAFVRKPMARALGLHTGVFVPVRGSQGTLGVVEFLGARSRPSEPDLITLAESIAAQLGQFIDRRRAEARVRESEARSRAILDSALDAIVSIDFAGRLTEFNPAAERLIGFRRADVLGLPMAQVFVPPELREAHDRGMARHLRTGEARVIGQRVEMPVLCADGTTVPVELSITRVNRDGLPAFTGVMRDIRDRKAREQALAASEARTRSVIEHMLEGLILVHDETGLISHVNAAAERMFGYEPGEMVGRHVRTLVPEAEHDESGEYLASATARAMGATTEWQGRRKDGQTFPLELQLTAFETVEGRLLAGFVRDLSERHAVERMKKQFVSTVSHELRTPLTSIRGSLGLLATGALGDLSPDAARILNIAERNVIRLVALINDILDLERLGTGQLTMTLAPTALGPIIDRAIEAVAATAAAQQITLEGALPPDVRVRGDADRLVQVVVNLLSNAIKFSTAGAQVLITAVRDHGVVRVTVLDRGPGVPEEWRETIFEPFRQVEASDSRQKGGTGLGLAICRAIVEQHEGQLGVAARDGGGSAFWFSVPADAGEAPA